MTKVQVIALRPAATVGSGDVLRTMAIANALRSAGHEVSTVSILRNGESLARALAAPTALRCVLRTLLRDGSTHPLQWVLVQALADARSIQLKDVSARSVYVTSRVVPNDLACPCAVDFVDALSRNAGSRAVSSPLTRSFWLREQRLIAAWETSIASRATVTTAVSQVDARHIGPTVQLVPIEASGSASVSTAMRPVEPSAVFTGNLYYPPNREAAGWILANLLPELEARLWRPEQMVIAGRRPGRRLSRSAARAGVTFLANVPDMGCVLGAASVAVAPMQLGSGMQTKVVDALLAGLPVVMTPKANEGLGLQDSSMVRIVERVPERFADAVESLASHRLSYDELPQDVAQLLARSDPGDVARRWLSVLQPLLTDH